MSNSLDPDQDRHSVDPDLGQTVWDGYQQTTKVAASKERVADIKCVFEYLCQHNIIVHLTLKAPRKNVTENVVC